MRRKSSKYLEFYKECMKTGKIPSRGLCGCAQVGYFNHKPLKLVSPSGDYDHWYWGIDGEYKNRSEKEIYAFTPLR